MSVEVDGGWRRESPVEEFMLVYVEEGWSVKECSGGGCLAREEVGEAEKRRKGKFGEEGRGGESEAACCARKG